MRELEAWGLSVEAKDKLIETAICIDENSKESVDKLVQKAVNYKKATVNWLRAKGAIQ